ncbi:DUF1080 domain-containing protein [Maribacter algarum]|uniref:DUF1080 domain-containing protein n=1 Tax=Maribacter algarum (ex Zhang et al. 2020) TaxID=2578118 RepID=A0A5S3PGZ9_9FLAO|nr:DUF1080 domain-containing protein [Maribacter algarum]TMM53386.1 DUF1080 domain-containing protein [Maribacter algarum]
MNIYKTSIFILLLIASCTEVKKNDQDDKVVEILEWNELIDSDLSKWDTYLSYQHQVGYDGSQPKDEQGNLIPPIGLNNPDYDVFTTFQEGEETIIRNSGEYYGCLITKDDYENYHFQIKYKWGNKKWAYREDLLKDSGILYHSVGPYGIEYWRSWMLSQEFQIMEGHTGDFWSQENSVIDVRAYKPESVLDPLADKNQDYIPIGMNSPYRNYCQRSGNYENPHDEWNTLDLYCFEGKSLHMVNGEVVMILKNSRYVDENGTDVPLTRGKIQLQSEAAEVFFKDIRIRKIDSLMPEKRSLF